MGKVGRIACIATPGVLTVISLLCLLVVFMGGLNKNDANLRSLWFFKMDTTDFKNNIGKGIAALPGTKVNNDFLDGLSQAVKGDKLRDFYNIHMWNYCSGSAKDGAITFCSPRTAAFHFNPIQEWGLNTTDTQKFIPDGVNKGLKVYASVSKWMFTAYAVAFWATVANFVVGFFAICSRLGSLAATIVSVVATIFTFLAALTSTILFSTVTGTFNTALKPYGIKLTVGTKMMSLDWIAVAFSLGATLFWTISICCCSGKSSSPAYRGGRTARDSHAEKGIPGAGAAPAAGFLGKMPAMPWASKGYQPLGGARGVQPQGGAMELGQMGGQSPYRGRETAYEPFRQH